MPERIVREAPPSLEAVTISWTCFDLALVKTFVNSGDEHGGQSAAAYNQCELHQTLGIGVMTPLTST